MKNHLKLTLFTLLTSSVCYADYPSFKPGLWQITNTAEGQPPQTSETCIDENTQKKMTQLGQEMIGAKCTGLEMTKKGDNYVSDSVCNFGSFTISTNSSYTGDFQNNFQFVSDSKIQPPMMGNSGSKMNGSGKYLGQCPANMKPGDTKLQGGQVVNPEEMMKGMPKDFMKNMSDIMQKMPK